MFSVAESSTHLLVWSWVTMQQEKQLDNNQDHGVDPPVSEITNHTKNTVFPVLS